MAIKKTENEFDEFEFEKEFHKHIKNVIKKLIPSLSERENTIAYEFILEYINRFKNFSQSYIQFDYTIITLLIHEAITYLLSLDAIYHDKYINNLALGRHYKREDKKYFFRKYRKFILHDLSSKMFFIESEKWSRKDLAHIGYSYKKCLLNFETQQFFITNEEVKLSPDILINLVAPFIKAIADLQSTINNFRERYYPKVTIRLISQNSPITIGLNGAGEAINSLKEDVIPWRKENAKVIAEIQTRNLEADIKRKEAETLEIRARSQKDKAECEKIKAEAAKMRAEAEQIRIENDKKKFELDKAKFDLAFEIVAKFHPDLEESQRITQVMKLLPSLNTFAMTEIDVSFSE